MEKVARISRGHSSLAGDSPPEHFEPNWRSVATGAIWREASKVLASQYWRSKIRGRNFGLKLKFYYANRPLGTRKWHQNWNWTPNEPFLLVKSIDFQEFWNFTNKFYLVSNSNSDAFSCSLGSICIIEFHFQIKIQKMILIKNLFLQTCTVRVSLLKCRL